MQQFLTIPALQYENEFSAFVLDFFHHNETRKYNIFQPALDNFPQYVQDRLDESQGINLPPGFVKMHSYWLTDETNTIYGTIRYRPSLDNEYFANIGGHIGYDIAPSHRLKGLASIMLQLLLQKIDKKENSRVLIGCNITNIGSMKVIENNGGIFNAELYDNVNDRMVRTYWVPVP
ncbi:GNAT family N-acetyltransferase [Pseudoflavitalea sp. G-6-1-2]|uniref:GNAT family N-acetyltransferase n=1 Tax=Pseudoflavitalea sp. G-6-1-2 TaxID=2728841 RepID=UPI00146D8AB2|nr:GNAT family N-acetyltransferase [Pseudoflavitalea sp. G-6-1-2]NML23445.1 GNAT family N-acetyltransferase [Pseudoflavitalea sp. G-6-1-2]